MPSFITRRLGLRKPHLDSPPLITEVDGNWDVLDRAILFDQNLADVASTPAARANLRVPVLSAAAVVATANVTALNTYLPVIDGLTVLPGMQILLTGQTDARQNGPWLVSNGPGIAWTRPVDYASGLKLSSRLIAVSGGTVGAGQVWVLAAPIQITVDTDVTTWIKPPVTSPASQGAWNVRAASSATSAAAWDYILASTAGGTFAIAAPTPVAGKQFGVKWVTGSVAPTLTGSFNSTPTFSTLDQAMEFISDGTSWYRTVRPALAQLPDYPALTDARYDAAGAATAAQTASVQKAFNLSDVASTATTRLNLGLGSAATQPSSAFLGASAQATDSAKVNGVAVTGTPSSGMVPIASSSSAAVWGNLTIAGQYIGAAATFAALPTTDTAGQAASNGDWAFLNADVVGMGSTTSPQYPRGAYVYNGSTYSLALPLGADFIVGTSAGTIAAGNDSRITGAVQPGTGDIGGTTASPTVIATHLSSALPIAQGGTGSGTQNFVDLSAAQTIAGVKTFSSGPVVPTAAVDTNTTQAASTAFVLAQAAGTAPVIDGTATVGTSTRFARQDHVHPTDTSRAPLASPTFTGTPAAPTATASTNTTQVATTAFVVGQASSTTPVIDGTAAVGTGTTFARADHVHPTDTTRLAVTETVNTQSTVTGTYTIPDVTTATMHRLTLTGSTTFTMPTAAAGKSLSVTVVQDATGSRVPTFTGVKWAGGTTPTFSTGANKIDDVTFVCTDGSNWKGFVAGLDMR